MKTLAIIVTYYPASDLLHKCVSSFIDDVDHVLVWENTPDCEAASFRFLDDPRIEYVTNGENSISKALNYAWNYAMRNGYDALLTMDQDSVFENFHGYYNWVENTLKQKTCICSPWYYARMDAYKVFSQNHVITSGMMLPVSILDALGGYNEDFAVDGIDIDLCLRARNMNYDILQNSEFVLRQRFGQLYHKKILGHVFSGSGYSAWRLYGIFRNYIITYRRNGRPEWLLKQIHWNMANYPRNILFCESNKFKKLFYIMRGICEGWLTKI